jgi:ankyrin repeat protein
VHCTNDSCATDEYLRNTPLKVAAVNGHVEVVRVFLEGGADAESTNIFQWNALHRAAMYGHLDVCRLLLDWGTKVDSVGWLKISPLHYAASWGHLSVVKLLVERGADVRLKNYYGRNASYEARRNGNQDVADWLDSLT